jgi:hypothetical protein
MPYPQYTPEEVAQRGPGTRMPGMCASALACRNSTPSSSQALW